MQFQHVLERHEIMTLNDALRRDPRKGKLMVTSGLSAMGTEFIVAALAMLAKYANFTQGNDPHGEHDFGNFELAGQKLLWKIDYYDRKLEYHSDNPADPSITTRVLTLMLAQEY